jgi:folylpolyglutamate synthase/dihydropteroate synthase
VLRDKDVASIVAPLTTVASRIVCTAAPSSRAMRPSELAAIVAAQVPQIEVAVDDTPRRAIALAAMSGAPVVVAGSLYLAGAVRPYIS